MIIWGWGKVTKQVVGSVFERTCNYCNRTEVWKLYVMRTWFTLFFIPIIPYSKKYCIGCPKCGSYMELAAEEFEKIKLEISGNSNITSIGVVEDSVKYAGKTETQISYLKQMEEVNK
jgi:hypothetical protein